MIERDHVFDPVADQRAVEPFGFVDLKKAFVNGVIESQIPESEVNYNGIDDPSAVLGRPKDIFEALEAKRAAERAAAAAAAGEASKDDKSE